MNDWNMWDISLHEENQQIKKQNKAISSDCKPINIFKDIKSGEFPSSRTGEIYKTTLTTCTCVSFGRDHTPCKHMYRLAFELNIMTPPAELSYSFAKPEALNLFDTVSQEAAHLFVYNFSGTPEQYFKFKDSAALRELIGIGFVDICTNSDIITDIQLTSMNKADLLSICSAAVDCPAKYSKKQIFIDYIKAHNTLLEKAGDPPLCVCPSPNIGNLYNTIKAAYHRKYPSESSSYWVDF